MQMESFKVNENYGSYCDECGKSYPGKTSTVLTIKGVNYTLCESCFKRFLGQLYLQKESVFEELISTIAAKDRNKILKLINK